MAGQAERRLRRFGRRYAVVVRLATLLPIAAVALLRATPSQLPAIVFVVGAAVVWTCGYGWWLQRTDGPLPVAVDVVVLLGVCLSIFVTDAVEHTNIGWIRLLVTFACVTYQWHTSPLAGGVAALAVDGGLMITTSAAGADPDLLVGQAWVLVAATLSRAAWLLVRRAAARADRMAAEAAQARRDSLVAAAVRAGEREFAAALHDTAAATLLMVGSGQVRGDTAWLAPQARRDLERLRTDHTRAARHTDLVRLLDAEIEAVHLDVEFDAPDRLPLPSEVATALADATREALNNVRRHAGTGRAVIRLGADEQWVRLDIVDEGNGFQVDDVPATRRGLRESVRGRLSRIGGTAAVSSSVGAGTAVRLAWGARGE
ncbi:sensor histidine kinase [Saccharothrix deserti]|uniref:sensor histidine kinase n=1 Tax=Saccharothrix deserti TaxID=2593674 RepID=UPI00131C68A6|nr:ATP-binding protein [Saccharothrix deserti]